MLRSQYSRTRDCALAALDAGWGTGIDDTIATILRTIILQNPLSIVFNTACATAVAGIGKADPAVIASLLTELVTRGSEEARLQIIHALHHRWGQGQDDVVMRVVETMVAQDPNLSERTWSGARDTLGRAWDYQPPHVVVSLIDRMVTNGMHSLLTHKKCITHKLHDVIAAWAPGWTHLPTAHMIERITHHVAYLCAHAYDFTSTCGPDLLISAWAQVIAAGAEQLSVSDIHAVLSPLWDLSPHKCLTGCMQGVRR